MHNVMWGKVYTRRRRARDVWRAAEHAAKGAASGDAGGAQVSGPGASGG